MIATHDFGYLSASSPESAVLEGGYIPAYSGFHLLEIQNHRPDANSTYDLANYIDKITLAPENPMLGSDGVIFSSSYGTELNLSLNAGSQYAGMDYWLWTGFSGTFPGTNLSGINIPLNFDSLVTLSLLNPGFPGNGFVGQLDGQGAASASFYWKPEGIHLGMTIFFTYVVLSPGMNLPVLAASNPVNATAVPMK